MIVKIPKWANHEDETFEDDNKVWGVSRLIDRAKHLKPFKIPLMGLNIYDYYPKIDSMRDFVAHMRNVLDADLTKPIILDEDGYVMDGKHRIAKALLEEKEYILAVRFDETPPCDYERNKNG